MIKLFIIDDHQIMINGIIESLRNRPDIQVVGFALKCEGGLELDGRE